MISITVNRDGTVSTPSGNVFLGNKFENLDETLSFTFPDEFQEYNKYLIGYHKRRKVTVILPINNNIFYVTTGLTYLDGDWMLYAMCRQQVLDLSSDEEVDISPKEGEHVFISDGFSATVATNNIDASAINSAALDQNLKVIYEDLLKVKEELRSEQPIVIDLNIPMNLSDRSSGEIQRIELDDVKIDRNLFLDDEGKCKQFVNVKLSSGGVTTPYEFLCAFAGGTVSQINYCGSTVFWQPMIDVIEYSNIIALDFHENHDAENSFVFTLAIRSNLIAGEYYGFVKSTAGFDPEQHTVPVAIDGDGSMFVPTYPEIPDNPYNDVFWINIVPVEGPPGKIKVDKTKNEIGLAIQSNKKTLLMDKKGEVFFFAGIGPTQSRPDDIAYSFTSYARLYTGGGMFLSQKRIDVYDQDDVEYGTFKVMAGSYIYGLITRQDDTFTCNLTFIELAQSSQCSLLYSLDGGETRVYNRCMMSNQSETMTFQHIQITETGIKIGEFTMSSDNTVVYSEKEIATN